MYINDQDWTDKCLAIVRSKLAKQKKQIKELNAALKSQQMRIEYLEGEIMVLRSAGAFAIRRGG